MPRLKLEILVSRNKNGQINDTFATFTARYVCVCRPTNRRASGLYVKHYSNDWNSSAYIYDVPIMIYTQLHTHFCSNNRANNASSSPHQGCMLVLIITHGNGFHQHLMTCERNVKDVPGCMPSGQERGAANTREIVTQQQECNPQASTQRSGSSSSRDTTCGAYAKCTLRRCLVGANEALLLGYGYDKKEHTYIHTHEAKVYIRSCAGTLLITDLLCV